MALLFQFPLSLLLQSSSPWEFWGGGNYFTLLGYSITTCCCCCWSCSLLLSNIQFINKHKIGIPSNGPFYSPNTISHNIMSTPTGKRPKMCQKRKAANHIHLHLKKNNNTSPSIQWNKKVYSIHIHTHTTLYTTKRKYILQNKVIQYNKAF